MVTVQYEGDRVIVGLQGRRRDVLLTCGCAEEFAMALRGAANGAENQETSLLTEVWGAKVLSFDGFVAIRFFPPIGTTTTRVPMPAGMARKMADAVDFARQQAAYKLRIKTLNARN